MRVLVKCYVLEGRIYGLEANHDKSLCLAIRKAPGIAVRVKLGTSARGTLADRTPPPSRPYVGEIRIRALAIIGHLGDTYAAHGRSTNTQRIAEMENCFYARSQEIFT